MELEFHRLLAAAQAGDPASLLRILELYQGLVRKYSRISGVLDEDLYQTQLLNLLEAVQKFQIQHPAPFSFGKKSRFT